MEQIFLKAMVRKDLGKSGCKHLRKEGQIPGIVYRSGEKGMSIQVDSKELWHVMHTDAGSNVLINMEINDDNQQIKKTVIVKEIQQDPLNDKFVHVDFHEISLQETLKVNVPVVLKGEAIGVKEESGVLSQALWELEVECLPTNIPEHIDVHVEELQIGEAIHVKDITPPEGVKILNDEEQSVVSISAPEEEKEEEEVLETEEESAEPEVIKKGKKEEEAAAEGEE